MSSRGYARLLGTAPSVLSSLSRPQLVNGSWNKPKLSGRKIAELRKLTIANGQEWADPRPPRKHKERSPLARKGPKGHKFEREKIARDEAVVKKMQAMPKLIAEHKEGLQKQKKVVKGFKILFPWKIDLQGRR